MFGIDGPEFLVILLVLIVVVGPKDLPKMLKTIARVIIYVRSTVNEFRHQFDDAIKQVELNDLQKTFSDINNFNLSKELTETFDSIHDAVGSPSDNFGIKTTHHKSKKDKAVLGRAQSKANEDLTESVNFHSPESVSITSKNEEGVS